MADHVLKYLPGAAEKTGPMKIPIKPLKTVIEHSKPVKRSFEDKMRV